MVLSSGRFCIGVIAPCNKWEVVIARRIAAGLKGDRPGLSPVIYDTDWARGPVQFVNDGGDEVIV